MPIYKQTTEITNIDDLLSSVERDIEEVYFGDKQVFTVWGEYDGALPAQYSANGNNLADYRIYGSAGGVGDDSGTAYGYEVDMSVRSAQLFDENSEKVSGYINDQGIIVQGGYLIWTYDYFQIIGGMEYTFVSYKILSSYNYTIRVAWYDKNKKFISRIYNTADVSRTITAPLTAAYARLSIDSAVQDVMFNGGSTALPYEPYSNTITPAFIGDTPLGEDEYVDYGEQKVYRMINGTLTPTDPPVPFPALPTVDGTNIVDYAGQSAAVPSRFVAKYRKG